MKKIKVVLMTVVGLVVVVGGLTTIKGLQIGRMIARGESYVPPPLTVTVAEARSNTWESVLTAVGSLQAVQGIDVAAELPGRVQKIDFEPGTHVAAGTMLVEQDISVERAEERAAQSEVALARKNYRRTRALFEKKVSAKSAFDDSEARYHQAVAQLDNIRAVIAKKSIRAPFAGRLGIRKVNLGEFLGTGQAVVSLQSLDPIYVNFSLPQQDMGDLENGLPVRVTLSKSGDMSNDRKIQGQITAIEAAVNNATRNIHVQATLDNPGKVLRPGMYVDVAVVLPQQKPVLAIPITAVQYAPYSDSVFVVEAAAGKDSHKEGYTVRQQFVKLGEKQGDFVAVLSGLKAGEQVVSTGVFKLRNGQAVTIDNSVTPQFQTNPRPEEA